MTAEDHSGRGHATQRALLTQLRQELLGPVGAMYGLSDLLLAKVRQGALSLVGDVQQIHLAARHLLTLVQEVLASSHVESEGVDLEAVAARVRHEMGNKLNHVAGYCQLLLAEGDPALALFLPDLREI